MGMRQVTYDNAFRTRGLYCPNVLLRCVDVRFHGGLEKALAQSFIPMGGLNEFISVGMPGGSRAVLEEPACSVVFNALDIALRRHDANRLIIADHRDCAAYGGSDLHYSAEEERTFHLEKLREAGRIAQASYPRLEVVLLYQDWDTITQIDRP